jgi:hypothetical protein
MSAYSGAVTIRTLFATMIALALLAAPSAAFAAMPPAVTGHHRQAMQMGHCQSAPARSDHKAPAKGCCMAMCLALAVAPEPPLGGIRTAHASDYFVAPISWHGFIGEIATPPPKIS